MKFGYAEYPILKKIDEGKLDVVGFMPEDLYLSKNKEFIESLSKGFKLQASFYKQNINYLSIPFCNAINKSLPSLIRDDAWNNIDTQWGCLLNMPQPLSDISVMYIIINENNTGIHEYDLLLFYKNIFMGTINQNKERRVAQLSSFFVRKFNDHTLEKRNLNIPEVDAKEICNIIFTSLVATLNFIKYARVETKQLPAHSRLKDIDCKYVNQTNSNVRILNSKWFTTLVKSDAFKVRGHFRLQPYGEGMKQKKLIWINDFEKTGYTAPAQKLKQ